MNLSTTTEHTDLPVKFSHASLFLDITAHCLIVNFYFVADFAFDVAIYR